MIIKEDGTGVTGASVYADVADLDALALLRGEDLTNCSDTQKEVALYLVAQDYIDGQHNFVGTKIQETQGMDAYTSIVTFAKASGDLIKANCIGALHQLKGEFFRTETASSANGIVKSQQSKLDVLEKKTEYFESTINTSSVLNTDTVDKLLAPYTTVVGAGVPAMRY